MIFEDLFNALLPIISCHDIQFFKESVATEAHGDTLPIIFADANKAAKIGLFNFIGAFNLNKKGLLSRPFNDNIHFDIVLCSYKRKVIFGFKIACKTHNL